MLSCTPSAQPTRPQTPVAPPVTQRQSWADSVLATMTPEEQVGQLVMVGVYGHYFSVESDEYTRLARLVQERHVGGLILWPGDVMAAAVRLNSLQKLARVPLLVGGDFERGAAMRLRRATPFPDAMAIGATRNPLYAYRIGQAIAHEARAVGVHQNFAPVADINSNPLNPVINTRSFSDSPALVREMVAAFVHGSLDGGVLPTVKHFPGHGDTGVDSHLELPVLPFNRQRLDSVELSTFRAAIDAGVPSVMIAHVAVPALDSSASTPASLSSAIVSGVLGHDLHFNGLVITDAMDMRGVSRGYTAGESAVLAVKAGVDIVLMPPDEESALAALTGAVRSGEIGRERLQSSVRKILDFKHRLGLDTLRTVVIEHVDQVVGIRSHQLLAREVARSGMTLLRNRGGILPVQPAGRKKVVSVVLSDTDDYRMEVNRPGMHSATEQVGSYFNHLIQRRNGRIETLRLSPKSDQEELENAANRIRHADLLLLPVFVKVRPRSGSIGLPPGLLPFLKHAERSGVPTVVVLFGSPYLAAQFPVADVLLCAYGDTEPQIEAAVEALFGESAISGKLPVTIPGSYAFGSGLTIGMDRLREDDPLVAGFNPEKLHRLDAIVEHAIRDSAFPGAELVVVRNGIIAYDKAFGTQIYDPASPPINTSTMFDLASVSKVIGTTAATMKLYDRGKLHLDDRVAKYLPQFVTGKKAEITIRHLLTHRAGFPPFKRYFLTCKTAAEALDSVLATDLVWNPGDTTVYSDIGMITMGKVVEKIAGMRQDEYLEREFYGPLGMTRTMYNPPKDLWDNVAPTEIDTLWRKALVHGIVHDENACILGGVAGHAGLFSKAEDLAVFAQLLLNKGTYAGVRYVAESTVVTFTEVRMPGEDRYLGWDMKSPTGSSAGSLFSPSSFGHTGFTGTSIWIDRERRISVILLTNRVYPTRANLKIARVRPVVHDAVIQALSMD
jgi:beta-glucosidase-like glycosyl hydrolase/CubicO group peptidase (beta-lactamase class C family)